MAIIETVHKDGTVKVPPPLLKAAGLRPGVGIVVTVLNRSLIIARAGSPRSDKARPLLKRLHGSLKHIDWDATRRELRARWSAWRNQRSA